MEKILSAEHSKSEHSKFYTELEAWKLEALKEINDNSLCVYKLFITDGNGNNKAIARFLKKDEEGILYIGEGTISRLCKFINALNGTERSKQHKGAERYFHHPKMKEAFLIRNLKLKVTLTEYCDLEEGILLRDYWDKFGDLPPLNRTL